MGLSICRPKKSTCKRSSPSRLISERLLKSFGATHTIFSFMRTLEVLKLQHMCSWQYSIGVARCQIKWARASLICFTEYRNKISTLYRCNARSGEFDRLRPKGFKFKGSMSVQINNDLLIFTPKPLTAFKYTNVTTITNEVDLMKQELAISDHRRE